MSIVIGFAAVRRAAPHLFCALIACAIPIVILYGGEFAAIKLERESIHATAPRDFFIKNQGLVLQRAAANTPDILLLYGSSELIDPIPNRASDFFASEPTGFQVCPVGKAGTTSLIILQKVAALGSELRGRKVAVSLSTSWFLVPSASPSAYAGNFSLPAASGLLFGTALDPDLKKQVAKRMLQFPDTLAKSELLKVAASCLASDRAWDRIAFGIIWPLGQLQNTVFNLQDHFEALIYILAGDNRPWHHLRLDNGEGVQAGVVTKQPNSPGPDPDAVFRTRIALASEWTDLELLLRTLIELDAKPLILSMPVDVTRLKVGDVSQSTRQIYYDRMAALAARYHVPLVQFQDEDVASGFLIARREHPSSEGWRHYDRALDDFFHRQ